MLDFYDLLKYNGFICLCGGYCVCTICLRTSYYIDELVIRSCHERGAEDIEASYLRSFRDNHTNNHIW